jgi:pimeloyl-ACP methyl ester carboxylesterase
MDSTAWALHLGWLTELRTVITFDNRDTGRSSYARADYTPRDLAADAAAVLRELADGPADVLGYSLGGAVAQELALASTEPVRSLVLLSTWAGPDPWLVHHFRVAEHAAGAFSRTQMADAGALWLFTPAWFEDPANLELFRSFATSAPYPQRPEGHVRQWRADRAHDARDRLAAIGCPALVVCGADDTLVPPRFSEELARLIPEASLVVIPDGGHGALLERAGEFQSAVTDFLARSDRG